MDRIGLALRKTSLALKELAEAFESYDDGSQIGGRAAAAASSVAAVGHAAPPASEPAAPATELAGKKRRAMKEKDPDEPKKPMTSYFLFCDEKRAEVKATVVEGQRATAKLTELWHELQAPEKAKYEEEAERLNTQWRAAVDAYRSTKGLPPMALKKSKAAPSPALGHEVAETDDELPHALPPKPTTAVKGAAAAAAPVAKPGKPAAVAAAVAITPMYSDDDDDDDDDVPQKQPVLAKPAKKAAPPPAPAPKPVVLAPPAAPAVEAERKEKKHKKHHRHQEDAD